MVGLRDMRATDLSLMRIPGAPTLTPDGRLVAVTVTRIDLDDNLYHSDIWVMPTDGSAAPSRFTNGPRDFWPRFSPDGRWLAFLRAGEGDDSKPQLHVMPVSGGEPRRLFEHPLGVERFSWSPDSTRLAYVARVPEPGRYGTDEDVPPSKEPPRRITTMHFRLDNMGFTFDRRPHVFVIDAIRQDADPLQITRGDYDHGEPAWSPDGSSVAFVSARHPNREYDQLSDVFVAPAGGGDAVQVTRTTIPVSRPAFSPDGGTIWFCAPSDAEAGRNTGLWSVPSDASTEPLRLIGGRRQVLEHVRAGDVTAAVVGDDLSMGEVVAVRDGQEKLLSDFGGQLARDVSLRPMSELTAKAPDGYPVHGWVVKPAGTPPFPVLLMIHGGPFTQYGYRLFDEAQVYAGAGYAVVMGNPRGSCGYGEAHGRAICFDYGNLDSADLLALLEGALDDPDLDGERIGVLGGSYGGFMTTWLVGHTNRFTAAISERACNAFDSFEGSSDIGWDFLRVYIGDDPERVKAQSPLTYADRIETPMLLIHSEEDWRCPIEQAQRLFVALKRRRAEVEMLVFPAEGHELSRSGLPSHRLARFEAILEWWERHLKPRDA